MLLTLYSSFRFVVFSLLFSLLTACSTTLIKKNGQVDMSQIPAAIPKQEPKSRYGNPESYVVFGKRYYVMDSSGGYNENGVASWYGAKFHGRRTSSGETYNMYAMTAAHKSLPLPTYVKVTNLDNGKQVVVKVNDRGPFHENRIIDLSYAAAIKLDIVKQGTGLVEITALNPADPLPSKIQEGGPVISSESRDQSNGFFIQVGSFSDLANATMLKNKLSSLVEEQVLISEVLISGNKLYRVRIGPVNDIDTSDVIVSKLSEYGITEYRIVIN